MSTSVDPGADRPLIAQGLYSFRIGGSERIGSDLAVEYAARGYRVVCFAFHGSTGPFRDHLESRGVECVDLNYLTHLRAVRRVTYQLAMYRFLRTRRVRAIHAQHAMGATQCRSAARWAGIKHLDVTDHAVLQFDEQRDYLRRARHHVRYASAITGVHSGITDYFRNYMGVPANRLHVIPNGTRTFTRDVEMRHRVRQSLGLNQSMFACLYLGRLEPEKDLRTLLKAIARLPSSTRAMTRVFLAGDGSERSALEALTQSLNITQTIRFLGQRTDVEALFNMADAFVMTSITEGQPMALIEAMAAKLPCIATAVGSIPNVLAGGAGIIVQPTDADAVAEALARLASDATLRDDLGAIALRAVQDRFGLEPVVTAYLDLLGLPPHWPPSLTGRVNH